MKDADWNEKIARARQVERAILKYYKENLDSEARMPVRRCAELDIICKKVGNIEIKEDRLAHQTGNYALEYVDRWGRPSGIAATEAGEFVIVDRYYVVFISTESLRYLIRECEHKRIVGMGHKTKEGDQGKGWLIPREYILHSPYVRVLERWF